MQFTVEIPVRVSKSGGNSLEKVSYLAIKVEAENEFKAAEIVAGGIQREVDLSW